MSTTITKSEAARVLEDEIFALDEALKKGRTIMQEITDEYFASSTRKKRTAPHRFFGNMGERVYLLISWTTLYSPCIKLWKS